ncbi:hypothetical protein CCHL11_08503 [Colletotrichum chlorophyti]|uniref:NAD-dependent epimerase/dehydratase domain-containing protein n=1 Tax=Colletotrichum chlorophyti TaxID=708187 RepID=A0A1Q8RQD1_9PEZI|nr:hypothetical protein CCHL11_08503 [Colletotrichum chlorophyti]
MQGLTVNSGGTVLTRLLDSSVPEIKDLSITALVRKQDQADLLKEKGVNTVLFQDLNDSEFLQKVASEHDYVLRTVTGFHDSSAVALIEGLAERKKQTGKEAHYIHTSGTSNLSHRTITEKPGEVHRWSDKEHVYEYEEQKEAKEAYGQRTTDIAVVQTAERTGVKTYIMMPPTIYGQGTGLFNQESLQIPAIIRSAIKAGVAEYIGDGDAYLGHVHVEDLALWYELLFSKVLSGESLPSGRRGIYFSDTGSHNWREVATEVGKAGFSLGALKSAEPRSVSLEEAAERWFGLEPRVVEMNYASNSATKSDLATELGWKPTKTEEDWKASFIESFQKILNEQGK